VALPSNLTFAQMYERLLVEPLFRPFAEQLLVRTDNGPLFGRMNAMAEVGMSSKGKAPDDVGRGQMAGEIAAASSEALKRYTAH
jgi:hypothetical protein